MPNPTPTIFVPYHAVDDLHRIGTRALQPSAVDVTPGTLYCVTDESNKVERSNGTAWQSYSGSGGGLHAPTHVYDGTDPITGELHLSGVTAGWIYTPGTLEVGGQIEAGSIIATDAYFNSLGATPLNASQLTSGTVQDTRLSPNVALLNAANTFTSSCTFSLVPAQVSTGVNYAFWATRDNSGPQQWGTGQISGNFVISESSGPGVRLTIAKTTGEATWVSRVIASAGYSSIQGSASAPTGVATSVFTFPSGSLGAYLVYSYIVSNDPVNYAGLCVVFIDGPAARLVVYSQGVYLVPSMSGLTLQLTQGSGVTLTVQARAIKIF